MKSPGSLPAAIVAGSALIALGLAVGLRGPVTSVTGPDTPPASIGERVHSGWTPVPPEVQEQVTRETRAALDAQRERLSTTCWGPAGLPGGTSAFDLRLIFDARGRLAGYAVNDPHDAVYRPVADCLREHKPDIEVTPIGRSVAVEMALTLP